MCYCLHQAGERLPAVEVQEGEPGNKVSMDQLFKGKKGVLFAVPGAFTPGCSKVSQWTLLCPVYNYLWIRWWYICLVASRLISQALCSRLVTWRVKVFRRSHVFLSMMRLSWLRGERNMEQMARYSFVCENFLGKVCEIRICLWKNLFLTIECIVSAICSEPLKWTRLSTL